MVNIQQLGPTDVRLMRELLSVFARAFDDAPNYLHNQPSDKYLIENLQNDNFIPLVSIINGEVVGGLVAYELKKFEQERSEIYIYDLAVDENHRRKGIATGLIENLKSIASERGIKVIIIQADQGDDPAIALYSKLGEKEDVLHFDIKVG